MADESKMVLWNVALEAIHSAWLDGYNEGDWNRSNETPPSQDVPFNAEKYLLAVLEQLHEARLQACLARFHNDNDPGELRHSEYCQCRMCVDP